MDEHSKMQRKATVGAIIGLGFFITHKMWFKANDTDLTLTNPNKHGHEPKLVLYSYWQSSSAWRVRLALALKQIDYEYKPVNLKAGDNQRQDYINPMQQVPALIIKEDNLFLTQSLPIIEYIDTRFPNKYQLIPSDPKKRFIMRQICEIVNSGIQPLQGNTILNKIKGLILDNNETLKAKCSIKYQNINSKKESNKRDSIDEQLQLFAENAILKGFKSIENILVSTKICGKYCIGDRVTVADCYIFPQMYNALIRYGMTQDMLSKFSNICRIYDNLCQKKEFQIAHANCQIDTPDEQRGENRGTLPWLHSIQVEI